MIWNRRKLLILAATFPALLPIGLIHAQSRQPVVIGWLETGSREASAPFLTALKEGLGALGWREGTHYVIEDRWAEGQVARLPLLAQELAAKKPRVIVAAPSGAVLAAARAAPNTPIVQATGTSPVETGLAKSLARPGGMVTGVTNIVSDVSNKYLELLITAMPKVSYCALFALRRVYAQPVRAPVVIGWLNAGSRRAKVIE